MNDTVREILGLLEHGKAELQVAAAQVLGELRPKDPSVCRALEAAISRSLVLGRYATEALAKLGTTDALEAVVRCLWEHEGIADHVQHLLSELGTAAHPALARGFEDAPMERKARVLAVLGRQLTSESLAVFAKALRLPLLAADAARVLDTGAGHIQPADRKKFREVLIDSLDASVPEACMAHALAALGSVDGIGARPFLLKHIDGAQPVAVRAAALRGLAGSQLTAVQVKALLAVLEDPAQKAVHDAIRDLLTGMPEWPEGMAGTLKKLLTARAPEQRLFALRALRTAQGAEVVKIALKFLRHQDEAFRDAAAAILENNRTALDPMLRMLQMESDPAQLARVARVLARLCAGMQPRQLKVLADKAGKLMAARSAAGEALFDVVTATNGKAVAGQFVEQAVKLRRAKRYPEALHILARLATTEHFDAEARYQLGLTRLLVDQARPAESEVPGNPAMGFFAVLVRENFPLLERLRKEAMLGPDGVLRVARHFLQGVGAERRFGLDALMFLATRTKGPASAEAKTTLRTVGA